MLQQTQAARVVPYYSRFLENFRTVEELANASLRDVLTLWQGLGYNRRAVMLKWLAEQVVKEHGGIVPQAPEQLAKLPGIGKATAGAIAAFAFNTQAVFIETNIRRAYIHHFFKEGTAVADAEIYPLVAATVDHKNPRQWYWALMDYGAHLPKITANPNRRSRHYVKQSKFEGSNRQLRGKIIRLLLNQKTMKPAGVAKHFSLPMSQIKKVINELEQEGFIKNSNGFLVLL